MIIRGLFIILIVSTALILGNEFSVGFFIHPSLAREDHRAFLPAIQVFARFFGKIMPIWMAGTPLLHLLLLWLTWQWPADHTVLLISAVFLWIIVIVFSIIGPVPINDRVKAWDIIQLPADWEAQRRQWDRLNAIRVGLIGIAFVALLLSFRAWPSH
jgi:Domain of unknown function (DUF1772)